MFISLPLIEVGDKVEFRIKMKGAKKLPKSKSKFIQILQLSLKFLPGNTGVVKWIKGDDICVEYLSYQNQHPAKCVVNISDISYVWKIYGGIFENPRWNEREEE